MQLTAYDRVWEKPYNNLDELRNTEYNVYQIDDGNIAAIYSTRFNE